MSTRGQRKLNAYYVALGILLVLAAGSVTGRISDMALQPLCLALVGLLTAYGTTNAAAHAAQRYPFTGPRVGPGADPQMPGET